MASYLITGVSRGLGFEFLRQISSDPANTVVGLVRNKTATEKTVSEELPDRKNIHIVQGELTDYASLKTAVEQTASFTNGALDYVIANAAWMSTWSAYDGLGELGKDYEKLEEDVISSFTQNVMGNIHLFNLTLPLILKGRIKKVIAISSGHADIDMVARFNVHESPSYTISKTALNMAVAKFSAEYSSQGVLFMTVSPGVVDTGLNKNATPEQLQKLMVMGGKFMAYNPNWTGPLTADVAVNLMLSVVEKASVEGGSGGSWVSQFGNKQWL